MKFVRSRFSLLDAALVVGLAIFGGSAGVAQTAPADLSIELNKTQQTERGCQLTFVALNSTKIDISKLALETAFFKTDGLMDRLTVLDFKDLPVTKSKVRQFAIKDLQCADLSRILINGVSTCESAKSLSCDSVLTTKNRSKVIFGQ